MANCTISSRKLFKEDKYFITVWKTTMKLNDLDKKSYGKTALKENYELPFNAQKLSRPVAQTMLKKVRSLIAETKKSVDFYEKQTSPAYMKMVFMEQSLKDHINSIQKNTARIVIENEEVEKSQVVLASQDMVDSVQKMLEETSDMLIKELPALTASIESEIGVNESQAFNTQVSAALQTLIECLQQTRTTLNGALGIVTGQGNTMEQPFDASMTQPEEVETDVSVGAEEIEEPVTGFSNEEPEEIPVGGAGRAKR